MEVTSYGCSDGGGETIGGGDIHHLPLEYHISVNLDLSNTGAMSGSGTASGSIGDMVVVVAGRSRP